jgi:hypothetical protein
MPGSHPVEPVATPLCSAVYHRESREVRPRRSTLGRRSGYQPAGRHGGARRVRPNRTMPPGPLGGIVASAYLFSGFSQRWIRPCRYAAPSPSADHSPPRSCSWSLRRSGCPTARHTMSTRPCRCRAIALGCPRCRSARPGLTARAAVRVTRRSGWHRRPPRGWQH